MPRQLSASKEARVAIDGSDLDAGGTDEEVRELLGGTTSLLSVPSFAAADSCLGDAVFAELDGGRVASAVRGASLVAVGIGMPDRSGIGTDELCAILASRAIAEAHLTASRKHMTLAGPLGHEFTRIEESLINQHGVTALRITLQPRALKDIQWAFNEMPSFSYIQDMGGSG